MAIDLGALMADLAAESAEPYEVLSGLAEPEWARDTPVPDWMVWDQVIRLGHFDETATVAAADLDRPRAEVEAIGASGDDSPDRAFAGAPGSGRNVLA